MSDTGISRHFLTVDGRWGVRQVHYRRCGSGPVVLLLHQSPQSSRELEPLMREWSDRFTLVAPDSPGYGSSDPLGVEQAELEDFAAATVEFLDALGVGRCGVYGFHTGGMIGIALAAGFPDRVTALACNGVVVPTRDELAAILRDYLPALEPRWDGGHLAWLWARVREQTIFFPWHNRSLDGRMDFPMPAPAHQQQGVLEFLRAREHYHVAYRAAFVFRADRAVASLRVPALLTAADWDPLQPHLDRLGTPPQSVRIAGASDPPEALRMCRELLGAHPAATPGEPAATEHEPRVANRFVELQGGRLRVRLAGAAEGETLLVVHPPGASGQLALPILERLGESVRVIAPDLPGHGESPPPGAAAGGLLGEYVAALEALLDAFAVARVRIVGIAGGGVLATELAARAGERVTALHLADPPLLDAHEREAWREHGLPLMEPEWSGGHLLRCWHMVRDGRLYFPWFRRDRDGIRWHEPDLDDARIQAEVTDYLKAEGAWQPLLDELLDYPLPGRLAELDVRPGFCCAPDSPMHARARAAAIESGWRFDTLPVGPTGLADWLHDELG